MGIVCTLLFLYFVAVFARIILSWIPVTPGTFLAQINSALYTVTEPVLGPLRRAIPPVRIGMAALDLSPLIVILGIQLLRSSIC